MTHAAASHSLTLEVESKGSTALVHCHGRLYAGACGALYAKVHPLIPNHKRIVLDLTHLTSVDSMGLGPSSTFTSRLSRLARASNSSISANRFASSSESPIFSRSSAICAKRASQSSSDATSQLR